MVKGIGKNTRSMDIDDEMLLMDVVSDTYPTRSSFDFFHLPLAVPTLHYNIRRILRMIRVMNYFKIVSVCVTMTTI